MFDVDKILFSNVENKNLNKFSDILFNISGKQKDDSVPINVFYFSFKNNKTLIDGNVINSNEKLIVVGFCEKTNMINVCFNDDNVKRYFWANFDEVEFCSSGVEYWKMDEVKNHYKSINEKWITERNIIKELKKKSFKEELKEPREKKNNKLKS